MIFRVPRQLKLYTASWSRPCQFFRETLHSVLKKEGPWGIELQEIDIDEDSEAALAVSLKGVPTLVLEEEGSPSPRQALLGNADYGEVLGWLKEGLAEE